MADIIRIENEKDAKDVNRREKWLDDEQKEN